MITVVKLYYSYDYLDRDHEEVIGVYSSDPKADEAIKKWKDTDDYKFFKAVISTNGYFRLCTEHLEVDKDISR